MLKFIYCINLFYLIVFLFCGCSNNILSKGTVYVDKNHTIHLKGSCKKGKNEILIKEIDQLLKEVDFSYIQYCGKCIDKDDYESVKNEIQEVEVLNELEIACYDISQLYNKSQYIYDFLDSVTSNEKLINTVYDISRSDVRNYPVLSKINKSEFNNYIEVHANKYKECRDNSVINTVSVEVVEE